MGLDAWITGNYGEDHPDNLDDRSDQERHEATLRAIDAERERQAVTPDELFSFWTPDEVAECLDVGDDLYAKLWKLVEEYRQPRQPEYPEEKWVDGLKRFWNRFTPDEQRQLNEAARKDR